MKLELARKNLARIGVALIAALACAAPAGQIASAQQQAARDTVIQAGRVLADPANGRVLNEQSILVRNGRIVSITAGYSAPGGATIVNLRDSFVLPGLIDSHVHLTSEQGPDSRINQFLKTSADQAIDGAGNALKTLNAGFTTVADLGGDPEAVLALRSGIAKGVIPGPRIIASAGAISIHGGHGDANGMPRQMANVLRENGVCSGADDCRRAVREKIRDGADIIKVLATGGVLSQTAAGLAQQFTDEELKAIIDAAHSMGRKVTAHAHGVDGINSFLRAGGDSIEHGSFADAESARLFKEKGAWLIPTLLAGDFVLRESDKPNSFLSAEQQKKAREAGPRLIDMARRMHQAGVKIAFGTDTGVSAHGDNAQEFALLVKAGFTPLEAIKAATVSAAEHFDLSNEIGSIAAGKAADIIAVKGDPTSNVRLLENVSFVMKGGKVYKQQ